MRLCSAIIGLLIGIGGLSAQEPLWVIEQEFVKLGKQEVYQNYKKGQLKEAKFPVLALQQIDEMQYIYLIPVRGFEGLGTYFKQTQDTTWDKSLLNFSVESLQLYLEECSFIPQGKESYLAFPFVYFHVFTIDPGYEGAMEKRLKALVQEQRGAGTCFRTWKVIMGADLPKYIVGIFCNSAKEGESLEVISAELKNSLRKESHGMAKVLQELSTLNGKEKI